ADMERKENKSLLFPGGSEQSADYGSPCDTDNAVASRARSCQKMNVVKDNKDLACFYTTKHSWRGKLLNVVATQRTSLRAIAAWIVDRQESPLPCCHDESALSRCTLPSVAASPVRYKRVFSVGTHGITTYNPTTLEVTNQWPYGDICGITPVGKGQGTEFNLTFRKGSGKKTDFSEGKITGRRYNCYKHHWSDTRKSVSLEVTPGGIDQIDPQTNRVVCSYDYRSVEGFAEHLFASEHRDEIIKSAIEHAGNFIGITLRLRKDPLTFEDFVTDRLGKYGSDESITSLAEFVVQKISPRHSEPVKRILCLTETCLVERDPASYNIVTIKPFGEVFALICDAENPQVFTIEFIRGQIRKYCSTDRDSLMASLLDGVRASGNRDVCVKMAPTQRGQRWGLLSMPVDEEVESLHLKFLAVPPNGNFADAVFRFNANVSYSGVLHAVTQDGLFSENKEKLISNAVLALLSQECELPGPNAELESHFQALRRLVASKAGFQAFTQLPKFREKLGVKTVKALKRNNNGVTHAAIDMLCALMCPMHDDYDLRQEQLNKASLMSSKKFLENLLEKFVSNVDHGTGALVISSLLDFLTFALCAPYSETSEGQQFDMLLEMVASNGRTLFKLFQHPSMAIVKGAGLVMKAIIEEGDKEIATKMQELALSEGALPRHLHTSMFTISSDQRMLTNRQLSRHLDQFGQQKVPDWQRVAGKAAKEVEKFAKEKADIVLMHWRDKMGIAQKENPNQKPVVLRKRRQRIKIEANWELFYYRFQLDHARSNLIWNLKTREELRDALEGEMRAFGVDRELGNASVISWNHQEFEVKYECLSDEIKIGDYYLRLLLEEDETDESGAIKRSYEFFNELYHRFLLTPKVSMKCLCLQALTVVYGKCCEEIGPFTDTKYIMGMLDRSTDKLERDRLILFLNKLILNKKNVKEVMDSNGVRILVDLLTLAHLHTSRATVPLQMQEFWSKGVLTAKTRCWAQGMDGWRPLQAIPQLKWCLLASGQAVMNETDLATLILNMLITMCSYYPSRDQDNAIIRPLPKIKRMVSDNTCLPHIVQLLLTFDPILVEKVANVLYLVMQDNPNLQRLYLTGIFFFIMMYTGSNVLPVARFLKYCHLKQAFKSEEAKGTDIVQRSVLGPVLPEAMVCYLENYEAERFSEIFLGEFDTPEAIWSSEMRRMMIEKIATHLADFSPRLYSNTRALYQYCPIPVVSFPQLENELFCNIYYLRHLCDANRFPNWPIREPVKLLKDTLEAWKREVEKKPPSMSVDDAYEVLNLLKGQGQHEESKIRKAYFRLAQKICLRRSTRPMSSCAPSRPASSTAPTPRTSSSFSKPRASSSTDTNKTITMETGDEQLFSKTSPLLPAAIELAFHTVCGQVCKCYSVAAQFEECREKIIELPNIIRDLCHVLYYGKGLPRTAALAVQCVSSFAVDYFLQTHLYHAGVLWHLLVHLFNYDYTLEESGVATSQDTNQQEVANSLAKLSLVALSRLGGYTPPPPPPGEGGVVETNGVEGQPPENPTIRKSLAAMLTPYISKRLGSVAPAEVLKLLNSNSENPYLIWNNGTRAELLEFLEDQQEANIRRGENDKSFGSEFVFSDHGKELIVGEIFVRVYNEQPAYPLEYPKAFSASLLDYVGSQAQYLTTLLAMSQSNKVESQQHAERLRWAEMALEALRNVIKNNPGSETECIGHFKLLFSLLRVHGAGKVQQLALEVVNTVTSNQDCVANIAESLVLSNLLVLLHSLPSSRQLVLETLYALTSNTKIVKEAMTKGALIYLLDLFCNSTHPQVRSQTAELFSKMTSDKLVGPKGTHENPELIWNDGSRETVSTTVREMMLEHFKQQKDNPDVNWRLPEEFTVAYGAGQGELAVGGVFLRIFIAQPGWVLRKPREFLVSLLETLTELYEKNNPNGEALETVTTAAVCLFSTQTQLCDQVPPLGHLPRILAALTHKNNAVPKSSIRLIHVLSDNEQCVRSMASLETIGPLMSGMKMRADMAGLACEALNRIVDLVPYLLRLLEGIGLETLDNPSATKAQIVKALKSMTRSLQYGEQVNEILARSTVWSAFKDQKHDLFISESQTAGYLTGPGVAGYLTAGTGSTVLPSVPPPVDNDIGDSG
ncbi:unnamed protein product, partial [Coregonus sp. 'balchen']